MSDEPHRRSEDLTWPCRMARYASLLWDWVDKRQIDAHVASAVILIGTVKIAEWAMTFVDLHPDKPGLEVAAIIGAVMVPWSALQGFAVKFIFERKHAG